MGKVSGKSMITLTIQSSTSPIELADLAAKVESLGLVDNT